MYSDTTIGFIIAGGASRRMGGAPKGLLELAGEPVLAHVIRRLAPQVGRIILNSNLPAETFAFFDVEVLPDLPELTGEGPLAGLQTCLAFASDLTHAPAAILTVPGDCPFLPEDLVARLGEGMAKGSAAIAASGGRLHPLTGLWHLDVLPRLRRAVDTKGLRAAMDWAADISAVQVAFAAEPFDPFFNINTPDDLAHAEALAKKFGL